MSLYRDYQNKQARQALRRQGKDIGDAASKSSVSTHWSPLLGVPDTPENYHTVSHQLLEKDGTTEVTITQDNNASQEEKEHSERNWNPVLEGLKNLLEK